ncbi:MAG: 4Fe-4S binding protein [Salinivirgaceae bacterium]|jgi:NAD-dependent dihydropyrimidine dehydrogenase PreA subunit|nr:4Fe-4S binding protein [Salinivirgaceae bacterium]
MIDFKYLGETVSLILNKEKCNGCGMCVKVCPHAVFEMNGSKAELTLKDYCMECGACQLNCAQNAIKVTVGNGCGCATGIIEGYFGVESECCSDSTCC